MNDRKARERAAKTDGASRNIADYVLTFLVVALAIYVAANPGMVFAPIPKVVLFLLMSILTGLLFGRSLAAKVELSLPGFTIAAVGTGGFLLASLFALDHLAKPEIQIAAFNVFAQGRPVMLEADGKFDLELDGSGITVTHYLGRNTVILVFPEQVPEARARIEFGGDAYRCVFRYAGTRRSTVDLKEGDACENVGSL